MTGFQKLAVSTVAAALFALAAFVAVLPHGHADVVSVQDIAAARTSN